MGVVPKKFAERIQYCEDHVAPFTTNAVLIGTSAPIVADFETKTQAARDAFTAASTARQAAKTATNALQNAIAAMSNAFADIARQVHAKAGQTASDTPYNLAQIPPPATPASKGAPGTPSEMKVALDGNGGLILKWKCNNPPGTAGTMYYVWRQTGTTGPTTYVGGVGTKTFTDTTVPAGVSQVTYKIQAARSTKVGLWGTFVVQFGGSGAGFSASVTEGTPSSTGPKMAA